MGRSEITGTLLMREHEDHADGLRLRFWVATGSEVVRVDLAQEESVCFVPAAALDRVQAWLPAQSRIGDRRFLTARQEPVVPVYTPGLQTQRRWVRQAVKAGVLVEEDDILPTDRYLMERFITSGLSVRWSDEGTPVFRPAEHVPELHVLSLDIETAPYRSGQTPQLYSIALHSNQVQRVYVAWDDLPRSPRETAVEWIACGSARDTLARFLADWEALEVDVLVGWHVLGFDLRMLSLMAESWGLPFALGREGRNARWAKQGAQERLQVPGRMVVDGIESLRTAGYQFASFSLDAVAHEILGQGKAMTETGGDKTDTIDRWYQTRDPALLTYNLQDAALVSELFEHERLMAFLLARSRLTGHSLDRVGGSAAAFNFLYLPRLHRQGYVAPHVGSQTLRQASPGGYVMDSRPGLYRNVLVLDFKSLYPSIMRTFQVDPWALWEGLKAPASETVSGYLDARFLRKGAILPDLLDQLWSARDQAKAELNQPLSQAIKILMNSFYGVLGSDVCRFYDPRLASSITRRGHEIMKRSRAWLEARDLPVIYGDTDSLFVWAGSRVDDPETLGQQLAMALNAWWREQIAQEHQVDSYLELEFETCYRRFHMPTIRGMETGSKKRYAGLVTKADGEEALVFKGMEAVRSDWTPLAGRFQQALYDALFHDRPLAPLIERFVAQLHAGELDDELWYRKRLRRDLSEYQKSNPPHVKAARREQMLTGRRPGGWVRYRMGLHGVVVPADGDPPLDYQHYLDRQLAPIADAVLHLQGTDFVTLSGPQLPLL